jgi:hypothetical protein
MAHRRRMSGTAGTPSNTAGAYSASKGLSRVAGSKALLRKTNVTAKASETGHWRQGGSANIQGKTLCVRYLVARKCMPVIELRLCQSYVGDHEGRMDRGSLVGSIFALLPGITTADPDRSLSPICRRWRTPSILC